MYALLLQDIQSAHYWIYISPFFRILDYLIGCILGKLYLDDKKMYSEKVMNFIEITIVAVLFLLCINCYEMNHALRMGVYFAPVSAGMIYFFAMQRGFFSKHFFQSRFLVHLGNISLEFFLIHQLVIRYISRLYDFTAYPIAGLVICLVISLVLSELIHRYLRVTFSLISRRTSQSL